MATTEDYTSYKYAILRADFARVDNEMQNMSTAIEDLAIRLEALADCVAGMYSRVAAAQKTADLAGGSAAAAQSTANNAGFMASALYKGAKEKGATE